MNACRADADSLPFEIVVKYASDHIATRDIVRRQTRSLHRHFAEQCRTPHGIERRAGDAVWIQAHPDLPVRAWIADPDRVADPDAVDELLADVRRVRPDAEIRWLLYRPPDQSGVRHRLEECGFELRVDCPGMSCAPGEGVIGDGAARDGSTGGGAIGDGMAGTASASAGAPDYAQQGLSVAAVANERDAGVWTSVYTKSNEHPPEVADAFAEALPRAWQARTDSEWFLGYVGERPVSCAKLRIEPDEDRGVAGLYQLATLPDYRGNGYGAAIMRRLMEYGRDRYGVRFFVLQAEPEAQRLYERLGFRVDSIMAVHILNG